MNSRRRGVSAGSILISLAILTLLATVFLPRLYARPFSSLLLTVVSVALALAIGLHIRFLLLLRREHHEAVDALRVTEREFQAIFDGALDGLLILDDAGTCLEANPAALTVLGAKRRALVGRSIRAFLDAEVLRSEESRGETRFVRPDGRVVSIEYSARMNYLPHRHSLVVRDVSERKHAEAELRESDERFKQMADNIQEIFWMLDLKTKNVIYANQAFETITGKPCQALQANPTLYLDLVHPEDRARVLTQFEEAVRSGQADEEFRILRPDQAVRWISVRGFPVKNSFGQIHRLVGIAQDITARKSAEEQITKSLVLAESASAEADALRKTTLALTQNLSMDYVLDTLLDSLLELIPCDAAQVLLVETRDRLFLARRRHARHRSSDVHRPRITWYASDHAPLMNLLASRNVLLVPDTIEQDGWQRFRGHSHFRSWLGVPLIASGSVLGVLSLGDSEARMFTQEHVRLAKSLAIPAAVAIQNARLYERAEIYGAELEKRVAELERTQRALEDAERRGQVAT